MITPKDLLELYKKGENIQSYLRQIEGIDHNSEEIIEISYELQAGSYIKAMLDQSHSILRNEYAEEIASHINKLGNYNEILEAGVGEATTLTTLLEKLDVQAKVFGFDLSWSRVALARNYIKEKQLQDAFLCTGDLLNIPFLDNSIDLVYTSHSIESNGGKEREILKELYRITKKFLVLVEPAYEFASKEAKERMESLGYCKNIVGTAESYDFDIVTHELLHSYMNPLNPSAITIIKKNNQATEETHSGHYLACPRFRTRLAKYEDCYFSEESMMLYPVIAYIPCLRRKNGILARNFADIII